jgi:hypothetical protein
MSPFSDHPHPDPQAQADERRAHPREATHEQVRLVLGKGGQAVDATIVDRSISGMRLRLDGAYTVTEVTVLSPATGRAYEAKVVWKSPPHMGLSIVRTIDMRTASGPDTAVLRKVWSEGLAR